MREGSRILVSLEGREGEWELLPLEPSPCTLACPTRINVRGYVSLTAEGLFEQALRLIREQNPFPGVCGRICPRPCEAACRRGEFDEPVAICALKRFVADFEMKRGINFVHTARIPTKERVAVIGAGPAGLSAALELMRSGYPVTVFEASDRPGGMMNVIPAFRLPRGIVRREVEAIIGSGIELVTGKLFGRDISWKGLRRCGYRALLLATGAWRPEWKWSSPSDKNSIHSLELLAYNSITSSKFEDMSHSASPAGGGHHAAGRAGRILSRMRNARVIVVGDGSMALDTARTAVRSGSRSVRLVISRSRGLAPAPVSDLDAAEKEGVRMTFLARPVRLLRRGGAAGGVRFIRLKEVVGDDTGRCGLVERKGSEFDVEADILIDAYARSVDRAALSGEEGLDFTGGGTLAVRRDTLAAGPGGVFAAGDLVSGPRSVVEAIASGRKAARAIEEHLGGKHRPAVSVPGGFGDSRREFVLDRFPASTSPRAVTALEEAKLRKRDFREVERGFSQLAARLEARRCLRCGPCSECEVCGDICEKKDIRLAVSGGLVLTVHAGREFWSPEPATALVEYGGRKSEAGVVRTVCDVTSGSCLGCGRCEDLCAYKAVRVELVAGGRFAAVVNGIACKGCGNCVSVCPTGAMDQLSFERARLFDDISAVVSGVTRVVFACRWAVSAEPRLPDGTILIETMCSGRVTPAMLLEAVRLGSPSVMVCRCIEDACHYGFGSGCGRRSAERARDLLCLLGLDPGLISDSECRPEGFRGLIGRWIRRKR